MIKVDNISRQFSGKKAVSNLSFELEKGQVLGLIGPNGAGKSTSMRMICGYLRPSEGRVTLGGHDVWQEPLAAKALLGYLPESAPLFEDLSVEEFLNFLAELRGINGRELKRAVDRVIDQCFLSSVRRQAIDTLSKGYRHRVCLAQSFLHDPPIIIFDEPTDGLDPNQKYEIRSLIREIRKDKAIILSTHILDEVEAVCTDVLLMNKGKKIFYGKPPDLLLENDAKIVVCTSGMPNDDFINAIRTIENLGEMVVSAIFDDTEKETRIDIMGDPSRWGDIYSTIVTLVQQHQVKLIEMRTDRGSLEGIFRKLTMELNMPVSIEPGTEQRIENQELENESV